MSMKKSRVLVYVPVKDEEKTVRSVVDEIAELYPIIAQITKVF